MQNFCQTSKRTIIILRKTFLAHELLWKATKIGSLIHNYRLFLMHTEETDSYLIYSLQQLL